MNFFLLHRQRAGNDVQRDVDECMVQIVIITVQDTNVGSNMTEAGVIFHFFKSSMLFVSLKARLQASK